MSLKLPKFASESEEADWLHEHRALVEAEFLIAGAQGKLQRRSPTGAASAEPMWDVPQDDLDQASSILRESGLWIDDDHSLGYPASDASKSLRKAS